VATTKEYNSAIEDEGASPRLWALRGTTRPSGQAFARAFGLAHAMVRDIGGRIHFWSNGMERLYGFSRAEAIGCISHELLKTEFPRSLSEINAELVKCGNWDGELRHRKRDGEAIVVASHWALDRDESGQPAWIIETNQDITAQKAAETLLRQRTAELQAVLDTAPAVVWVARGPQSVVGSRAAFEFYRLPYTAFPPSAVPETKRPPHPHFKAFIEGRQLAPEDWPVQRALRGETVRNCEIKVVFDDGSYRLMFGNAVPLFDENGQQRGAVSTFVDVTDRALAEAALRDKEAAEKANQAKSDFVALMSHEIRTPITSVIGLTELLLDSDLTPRQRHRVTLLKDAGELLLAIINDVLDMSKIEAGKLELEQAPLMPSEVAEFALAVVRPQAAAKNIELRREIAADLPACIKGDATRLRQILLNLLSNAVKFTERGSVALRASRQRNADAMQLRFEVADTGIGIDSAQQKLLFQPFFQVGRAHRHRPGTGLGLVISRRLVEAMGGTIGVKSRIGEGSVFWFAIPYEEIQSPATAGPTDPALAARLRARILVAEDEYIIREIMEAFLREAGHEVVLVGNGAEAIEALKGGAFDLMLTDVEMPEMGGLEAAQRVRQMEEPVRNIPIIALSAYAMVSDIDRCRVAGVNEHLSKPIRREALLAAVEKWIGTGQVRSGAGADDCTPPPIIDATVLADLESRLGRQKVMQLAGLFREQVTDAVKGISSTTDRRLIARQSHRIVSLAGNLGCTELIMGSRALMNAARHETGSLEPLRADVVAAADRALSALQVRYAEAGGE
jgi:PAS domain S-box-containing protein